MSSLYPKLAAILVILHLANLPFTAFPKSVQKQTLTFSHTVDVGLGNFLYVLGNHPDLGANDPVRAIRLRWTPGNIWTGQIAVEAGANIQYKFISRSGSSSTHCQNSNASDITPLQTLNVPSIPPPHYKGKIIFYHSGFDPAYILYSSNGGPWQNAQLQKIGPGRSPGEFLHRIDGIGEEGAPIQFVFHNGQGVFDKPPTGEGVGAGGDYYTELDAFFVQDGQVFNYFPPPSVSPQSISGTITITSTIPNILSRAIRVLLPRGYNENTWRRYPVLYLHDGQNVFHPGGVFGSWDVDITAGRLMRQGRMRETIIVAINNTSDRMSEYVPTGDTISGNPAGKGAAYAQYLIQNVKPYIDATYRTLPDNRHTGLMGSSLGGLITTYIGWHHSATFSLLGPLSPSYWAAPNFVNYVNNNPRPAGIRRIYTAWGTNESDSSMWNPAWAMHARFLAKGFVVNEDLKMAIGCGAGHNEATWAAQMPAALPYLFNLWDEPNYLAQKHHPFAVSQFQLGSTASLTFPTLAGFVYELQRSLDLTPGSWTTIAETPQAEPLPWSSSTLTDPAPPSGPRGFYRIRVKDWPSSQ
ncbi:MAG: alpha/beta hydrolase-fold protein [Methylacidiphilales bacterium]|nr:alpha/beta hydrolase-fold protein [Candidatus Methylacidiphilales bacterium]MDW8350009.1 alpha/beta hydrolase-fold protein [Verrucomicrobiae bacterium]